MTTNMAKGWVAHLISAHGWHEPLSYGRSMGLHCHCGKYFSGGVDRSGQHHSAREQYEAHVVRVVNHWLSDERYQIVKEADDE